MTEPLPLPGGGHIRVVHGTVTPEEAAALVLAMEALQARRRPHLSGNTELPGWLQAARLEAVGARLVATRADLF